MQQLLEVLREDWRTHGCAWSNPGFHAVAVHRIGRHARQQRAPLRLVLTFVSQAMYVLVRNVYGIELPVNTELGRRVKIAHQSGIVISGEAIIGDDCELRQNVTIGAGSEDRRTGRRKPTLESDVYVGAGAVIVGGVTVGKGARIGAMALVMTDVPPGATAFAKPARIMRPTGERTDDLTQDNEPAPTTPDVVGDP